MNLSDLPGISWLIRHPLFMVVLLLAALGIVVVQLLPTATRPRKAIADQTEWLIAAGGECHPGAWVLRFHEDSVTVEHDGQPGKTVKAKIAHPDGYAISASLVGDVGFGPKIRLVTIANLSGGRARLYLSENAAMTHCVHEISDR